MERRTGLVIGLNAEVNYVRLIRLLIWTYLILLIFEGALRKWAIPRASALIFILRAPVAIAAYAFALRIGRFPWNMWTGSILLLAIASFFVGWAVAGNSLFVAMFGVHANFMHILFIFLMGSFFDKSDVHKVGWFILLLALPMAILMIFQFRAGPYSFINYGAGGEGEPLQLGSAMGKIRPAGTFTSGAGVAWFCAMVTAFMFYGMMVVRTFPWWLNLAASASLVIAISVSGSRTLVGAVATVVIAGIISLLWQPRLFGRFAVMAGIAIIVGMVGYMIPVVREGFEVLTERFTLAGMSEGGSAGTARRFFSAFTHPMELFFEVPLWGHGLGLGTNAGAAMMTGGRTFLLFVEGEWDRNLMESGPILGGMYIAWRVAFVAWLGWRTLVCAVNANILPMVMWSATAMLLLMGQFGSVTNLGFAVFISGLCLAAMKEPEKSTFEEVVFDDEEEEADQSTASRRLA